MSIFSNPAAFFVAVLVAIVIVILVGFRAYKTRKAASRGTPDYWKEAFAKAKELGYLGAYNEWRASLNDAELASADYKSLDEPDDGFKPLTRSERRAKQFAGQTDEELYQRLHQARQDSFSNFMDDLHNLVQLGKEARWSLLTFTQNILRAAEKEIADYIAKTSDQRTDKNFIPLYTQMVAHYACVVISEYSGGKALQAIAIDLIKFVDTHFRMTGLNNVMYRHKQHVHYNDRAEGMSRAILGFFTAQFESKTSLIFTVPIDYLPESNKTSFEAFRKVFFHLAIDVTYANLMKQVERNNYAAAARKEQQEHEKNRRQRARRVTKRSKRS